MTHGQEGHTTALIPRAGSDDDNRAALTGILLTDAVLMVLCRRVPCEAANWKN